jgi:16S rRNA (cytosine967-C5)-methyltransferase
MNPGENTSINKGNHFHRYLQYASSLLSNYNGAEPLHLYLKKYFSLHKKHGSRDRKQITALCYYYFRLGIGVSNEINREDKLILSTFLLEKKSSSLLNSLKPEWNDKIHLNLPDKLKMVKDFFNANEIFPFENELSAGIDSYPFNVSFLTQPKLYIRIRPGFHERVIKKLNTAGISFEKINNNCLAFANNEKVSNVINIDEEAVIQDYNSQRIGEFITSYISHLTSHISVWDCCAASGGKSILAYDILKNIQLTVSDTRKNILENLRSRFAKAGIKNYQSFVADLSVSTPLKEIKERPDFIIADVPCSGSGTWARTPEQLHFFSKKDISKYATLQQNIVQNATQYLKEGGYLLYITCSVFKKENEDNVEFIRKKLNLELIESQYLKGYEMQADTLFAAMFKMPLCPSMEGSETRSL